MEEISQNKITFHKRPIPIPVDYRPIYKIAQIVLVLGICCRGNRSSLLKLHLFSWALKTKENREELREYIESGFKSEVSIWGIEPALNRALHLAVAENIIDLIEGKYYQLTAKGIRFLEMLNSDVSLMDDEKSLLLLLGKNKITDNRINAMSKQWSLFYAKN